MASFLKKEHAPSVLRIGIALVFLWFGLNQLFRPGEFLGYLPEFLLNQDSPSLYVLLNGGFETVLGGALLLGFFVRPVAFLLALHLLSISFALGYNDIMIRDIGLAFATFAIALGGKDPWCLGKN